MQLFVCICGRQGAVCALQMAAKLTTDTDGNKPHWTSQPLFTIGRLQNMCIWFRLVLLKQFAQDVCVSYK